METPENKQVNLKYSKDFMILALLVGLVMLTAHVYDMAPALIPTHFGLNLSSPMGYGPKSSLLVVAVIGICFGLVSPQGIARTCQFASTDSLCTR